MNTDTMAITWQILQFLPTVIGIVAAAFAGERSAHKFLVAACQIVYALAEKPLENHEKRAAAVSMLYVSFPRAAKVIPDWLLGKLIDIAWEDVVKPMATGSQAPTVDAVTQDIIKAVSESAEPQQG